MSPLRSPNDRSRSRRPFMVMGVATVLLASGCAAAGKSGVSVLQLQSSVNFGLPQVTPAPDASQPAGGLTPSLPGTPQMQPTQAVPDGNGLPTFQFSAPPTISFPTLPPGTPGTGPQGECPTAPPTAQAAKGVTADVLNKPAAGYYKWQLRSSTPVTGSKVTTSTVNYVSYQITNVSATTTVTNPVPSAAGGQGPITTFTYDLVEPAADGTSTTYTFRVERNLPSRTQTAGNVGHGVYVTVPGSGVALVKEVAHDAKGNVTGTFAPQPAVSLLQLQVQDGALLNSSGTDPLTGATLAIKGQVLATQRLDACGSLVDGWKVVGTTTMVNPVSATSETANTTYAIATQYGGLEVGTVSQDATSATATTYTTIAGQLTPSAKKPTS